MVCDEHGLAPDGSWWGQTSLQAERLQVYWNSKENNNSDSKHPADQEQFLKVGGGGEEVPGREIFLT